MSIRFGACIGIDLDKLTALRDCGYSYAETSLSAVAGLSDSEFDSFLNSAKNAGIPIEACNGFFPADIKIVGDSVDYDLVAAYTKRALARASALGVRVAVLGSAKSRAVPDGFDRKTAEEQFVTALRVCGDIAAACGIGIAIVEEGEVGGVLIEEFYGMVGNAGDNFVISQPAAAHIAGIGERTGTDKVTELVPVIEKGAGFVCS